MKLVFVILLAMWVGMLLERRWPRAIRWLHMKARWYRWRHRGDMAMEIDYVRAARLMAIPRTVEKQRAVTKGEPPDKYGPREKNRYLEELKDRERRYRNVPNDKLGV